MKTYQYMMLSIRDSVLDIAEELNKYGRDGWQVVESHDSGWGISYLLMKEDERISMAEKARRYRQLGVELEDQGVMNRAIGHSCSCHALGKTEPCETCVSIRCTYHELFAQNCSYELKWTDEVGQIPVCTVHGQNSRHHVDLTHLHEPCLAVDPYPKEDHGEAHASGHPDDRV